MRKYVLLCLGLVCNLTLLAQEKIYIHRSDKTLTEVNISNIDSVSFIDYSNNIYVNCSGTTATVINPLISKWITVTVSGADVMVNSTSDDSDISYNLSVNTISLNKFFIV